MGYNNGRGLADMVLQTSMFVSPGTNRPLQFLSEPDIPIMPLTPVISTSPGLPPSNSSVSKDLAACPPAFTSFANPVDATQLNPLNTFMDHSANPNTASMMAATFRAATFVASGSGHMRDSSKSSGLLATSYSSPFIFPNPRR
ncbi:hypothetical protein FBUS_10486 [Fasciolopsis buskii]|uniref:Uncharacterized protein n=1 Tax=Fasciolopsis buskii TaxID=27845 RepID=A0A8E0VP55_9TREM|nr:hypothetical protein FBUS_10486 [Fasciolopsis buski]